MADTQFVGRGWESKFGINISIKKADIEKLPTNKYGDVMLAVVKRKEPDEKSRATHFVKVDDYQYKKLAEADPGNEMPF